MKSPAPDGLQSPVRRLATRCGLMLPFLRRSLWVHGHSPIEFLVARRFVQSIMDERPHVGLVITAPQPDTVSFLSRLFPDEQALPMPRHASLRRWLRTLQPRHLLLLDAARSLPAEMLQSTAASGIPVSAINIADPRSVAPALLDAARQASTSVTLCVVDASVARDLIEMGVPSSAIATTGSLWDDGGMLAPAASLRRRFHLPDEVPVAAALDVPADEESLVCDAFAAARRSQPDLRLLWDPRDLRRGDGIRRQAAARGWRVTTPSALALGCTDGWDLVVPSEPGEIAALVPIASVASVGGSYTADPSGTVAAFAATARLRTLVGPCRSFSDIPWHFLESLPGTQPIDTSGLAADLAATPSRADIPPRARATESDAARRTHDALRARLPESPPLPPLAQDWRIPTWRDKVGGSRLWRALSRPLTRGRFDAWEVLSERLGHPRTLLCLGNGPSSEDPQLTSLDHDCLIRINWRWKARGILVNPQVVFVGDPATLHEIDGAIFGIWNRSLEQGMLLRHLISRGPGTMRYFTMERMSPLIRDHAWPARPTNGALMIAAAVALNPARLIIAGIDLYRHPEGRYPGDLVGTNAYSRAHTRTTDLAIIRMALAEYRGEVTILGDSLQDAIADVDAHRHD